MGTHLGLLEGKPHRGHTERDDVEGTKEHHGRESTDGTNGGDHRSGRQEGNPERDNRGETIGGQPGEYTAEITLRKVHLGLYTPEGRHRKGLTLREPLRWPSEGTIRMGPPGGKRERPPNGIPRRGTPEWNMKLSSRRRTPARDTAYGTTRNRLPGGYLQEGPPEETPE